MLRLVHPPPGGNGTDPPAPRRKGTRAPSLMLTPEEARHLRAAIRNIARAYGSLACLAAVIGVRPEVLAHKRRHPSAALALAVARAGGVTMEAVLSGAIADAGRCKACGHRPGDGRAVAAGGAR